MLLIVAVILVSAAAVWLAAFGRPNRDGRGLKGGVALAFGLAFSEVLDPPQKAATEEIEDEHRDDQQTASGEKLSASTHTE